MRGVAPAALLVAAGLALLGQARAEEVSVFIVAGQSNALGYGLEADLPAPLVSQPDVFYDFWATTARLPGGDYEVSVSTAWGPLEPKALQDGGPRRFGPELSFGRAVADGMPGERVAVLKACGGGTNILEHWERGVAPDPDYPEKSQLYHALLGSLDTATYPELAYPAEVTRLDSALSRLTARGDTYRIAAVVWLQGENEAGWSAAYTYEEHLRGFIADLRSDLGEPALPFVMTKLSLNAAATNGGQLPDAGVAAVRDAQTSVAATDPAIALVDVDDVAPDEPGGLHFTSEGYLTIGERLGAAYLALESGAGGGATSSSGSASSGGGGEPSATASGSSASSGVGGAGGGSGAEDDAGGGCSAAGQGDRAATGWSAALALAIAFRRRRRAAERA